MSKHFPEIHLELKHCRKHVAALESRQNQSRNPLYWIEDPKGRPNSDVENVVICIYQTRFCFIRYFTCGRSDEALPNKSTFIRGIKSLV